MRILVVSTFTFLYFSGAFAGPYADCFKASIAKKIAASGCTFEGSTLQLNLVTSKRECAEVAAQEIMAKFSDLAVFPAEAKKLQAAANQYYVQQINAKIIQCEYNGFFELNSEGTGGRLVLSK